LAQIRLVIFVKNAPLILKIDITELKARRVGYSNNQSKSCLQVQGQFQAFENNGFRKPGTNFQSVNSLTGY